MPTINHKIVGAVRYQVLSGGKIQLLDNFAAKNIVTVDVPQLKGVKTYGGKFGGKVKWYKGCVRQLQTAFAEIEAHGLLDKVIFWGGSYVPRMIRGGNSPSEHTFGCALDINIYENWLGATPAAAGAKGSVRELVPVFKKYGFRWGGNWGRPDGMHFEIARNMSHAEIDAAIAKGPLKSTPVKHELVLGRYTGTGISAKRFPNEIKDNKSFVQAHIREIAEAWGVDVNYIEWGGDTPALIRKD